MYQKAITGSFAAENKVYDGTTSASVSTRSLTGVVNGDDVDLVGGTATFDTKDVGVDKTVILSGAELSGADADNYSFASVAPAMADVTPKELTGSFTARSKVYDGTQDATVTNKYLPGVIGEDDVALEVTNVLFDTKNIGTGKTVTADLALSGDDAGNYNLSSSTATAQADITALEITGSFTAANKVYDGSNAAEVLTRTLNGTVDHDVVALSGGTATFSDKNVANGKTVTLSEATLEGNDAGNYTLTSVAETTANITRRTLVVTATAEDKVFNGTTVATVGLSDDRVQDDVLTVIYASANFDDRNVGTDKTVTVSGIEITGGDDAGNYTLGNDIATTTADITHLLISVSADGKTKVYGDDDPVLTYQITSGELVAGDTFSGKLSRVAGENVGTYAIQQGTLALSSNYTLSYSGAELEITKAELTVTADDTSRTYGAGNPPFTASYSGFKFDETLDSSGVTGDPSLTTTATAANTVGGYPITADNGTLTAANYSFTFVDGTLTITVASLTVDVDDQTKVYGDANPTLSGTVTGIQNNDNISVHYSADTTTASGVGTYPITADVSSDPEAQLDNYTVTVNNGTLTVTPATLTVTADDQSRVYGGPNPTDLTYAVTGFVNGDTESVISGIPSLSIADTATDTAPAGSTHVIAIAVDRLSADNYSFVAVPGTLTITKAGTLTVASDKSATYGMASVTLTATVSSDTPSTAAVNGGTVKFTVTDNQGNEVGTAVTDTTITNGAASATFSLAGVNAGNYNILAEYSGADNFTLSSNAGDLRVLSIAKATPVITWTAPAAITYGTALDSTQLNATANVAGTFAYTPAAGSTLDAGTHELQVVFTPTNATNYTGASASVLITVNQAELTVTAADQTKVYGQENPDLTGTVAGIQNGDNITADYGTSATAESSVGSYDIVPTLNDPDGRLDNYDVTINNGTLSISKAPLTVTADPKGRVYGDANPAFSVSYDGFVNNDDAGDLAGTLSFTTEATADSPVGDYDVMPGGLTSGNYTINFAAGTLTVTARPITVTADAKTKIYGDIDPSLTSQITSGSLVGSDGFSGSLKRVAGENAGSYAIEQNTLTLGDNYQLTYIGAKLTITKAVLTVTADNKSRNFETANPTLTATFSGFKFNETLATSGVTGNPAMTTDALVTSKPGTYEIVAGPGTLAANNYSFTFVKGTLTVVRTWSCQGFYNPVNMGNVVNTVKAGSTVPLKFECFSGATELTDIAIVTSLTLQHIPTTAGMQEDPVELTATGGTVLRYTDGQFIYNWSTKGLKAGESYLVTVTLRDGSTITAIFKMK